MKRTLQTSLNVGFALAIVALTLNAVVSLANIRWLTANNRRVLRTNDALRHMEQALSTVKDAETGQRGFLLTGEEGYLEPYKAAVSSIGEDLRRLKDLLDEPDQQRRVGALESRIDEKMAELRESVDLRRQGGAEAAIRLVLTGRGRAMMDDIRRLVGEMEDRERTLAAVRAAESESSLRRTAVTLAVASIATLVMITLLYALVLRHDAARERHEAMIQEQLERWQVTLASVGDAVIVTDAKGRVTFMNPLAESLCALADSEARGRPLPEVFRIVSEETRMPVEDPVVKVLREGTIVGLANHTVLIGADGGERPIHDSAAPVKDRAGRVLGVVLVFRDDTDRRLYERRLVESGRRKDEFLAMLAHELRNPLAAIRSAVEMFDRPGAEDHLEWAREVIGRQINHLAHLLDDLLDVSRITRDMIQIRKQLIDAYPIIRHAVEAVRPLIDDRGHHLELAITNRSLRLESDPVRLEQILVNLLTNAARYTPMGGQIRLDADLDGDRVVIRVRDNGTGIAPEVLPHIFDLFAQGERTLDRSEGGLGVGLTIVKKLVEMHGGCVSARSEGIGKGSEFTVGLPAAAPSPAAAAPPPPADAPGRAYRILVVDDNRDLARGLARLLRLLGHQVELAYDGPEGIEAARAYRPDVVLLDIGLPNLDGYEVARRLRNEEGLERALIIAITGYGQEEDRRRSREAGMDHHLTKPVDVKTIAALIARPA